MFIILFEWFEVFFVSNIFSHMVIILIYLLQKSKKKIKLCEKRAGSLWKKNLWKNLKSNSKKYVFPLEKSHINIRLVTYLSYYAANAGKQQVNWYSDQQIFLPNSSGNSILKW